MLFARYVSTAPLSNLINFLSSKIKGHQVQKVIPENHQVMLWWAGLRGAIAFALSVEVRGPSSMPIRTTTLVVCVFTIVILGGTTKFMLDYLQVPTTEISTFEGDEYLTESDYSDAEDGAAMKVSGSPSSADDTVDDPLFSRKSLYALRGEREISNWLVKIDKKYLKPIFCISKPRRTNDVSLKHSVIAAERDISSKKSDSTINLINS